MDRFLGKYTIFFSMGNFEYLKYPEQAYSHESRQSNIYFSTLVLICVYTVPI